MGRGLEQARNRIRLAQSSYLFRRPEELVRQHRQHTAIYILIDRSFFYTSHGMNVWSLYDCGAVAQNISLLATNYGLGTVEQAQAVIFPDILRNVLGVPESKLFAIGISIGYPDWDNEALKSPRSTREPVDRVVKYYGF